MSARVLFVDDEPNVLDGIRRQLRNRLKVETANGAAAGLAMIESHGPFAVVVSDMRMPDMNGARFLARVNEIAPDTVRMVLSGQADIDSTVAAVNEGHIFRFLLKPCDTDKLVQSINSGIDQYNLINAEKHLLENTLNTTVKMLVEVLGLINPAAQQRASQIEKYAEAASVALKLPGAWKYRLASVLSQVGCITLPADPRKTVPLVKIALGRSGDKGDTSNIGLIARRPDLLAVLREQVTPGRVREYLGHLVQGPVHCYDLPGIDAINLVCQRALGGGGMASLRNDALGKGMAQMLLDMPVEVPESLLQELPS